MEVDNDDSQPLLQGFCSPVPSWLKSHEDLMFSEITMRAYWRQEVPKIFSLRQAQNCLNYTYDEHRVTNELFTPMEQFICNSVNPQEVFQSIRMSDKPASLCGKVFRLGEPTYSCRDCAIDQTCVLCIGCFTSSPHRNHKYRMCTSGGGGYCDCGDVEAWKGDPFCSIHIKGSVNSGDTCTSMPARNKLDKDVASRTLIIFKAVLHYAYHILTHESGISFPAELSNPEGDSEKADRIYATVVYNDESHGFDQVINSLKKSISCNQKDAMEITTTIDREGRGIVRCDHFMDCMKVKESIEKSMSRQTGDVRDFRVEVVEGNIVAHQTFAMLLLGWMQRIMDYSPEFRHLFCEVVMEPMMDWSSSMHAIKRTVVSDRYSSSKSGEGAETMVERLCLKNTSLWKNARVLWQHLFISGMLLDYENKKIFAKVFTKHYVALMREFCVDDHEHAVSVMGLAVQFYTVPTIAHMLIAEHDALSEIFRTVISQTSSRTDESGDKVGIIKNGTTFQRTLYSLYDLKYLLGSKPEPEAFTAPMQKGFYHGFTSLLELLSCMHGMDPAVRQVDRHLDFEPDWSTAFNLHIKLESVISLMIEWCGISKNVFIKCYRATLKALEAKCKELHNPCVTKEIADHSVACIEYDVSSQAVSIHLPLSRLLAGLHLLLEKFDLTYDSFELNVPNKLTPTQLMEPVLRTMVMISQVNAGMWRRNGHALINQVYFHHNLRCRKEMMDKDVVMLQAAASLIPSDDFLVHVLNKYNLLDWARSNYEASISKKKAQETPKVISLVEEFLGLIITIISERHTPGIGMVSERDCAKKEVIQQLSVEPLPHSQLVRLLPEEMNEESNIDEIINEVATFVKATSSSGKGLYHLKDEYYSWYNLFFYHYTKEQQSKSEETRRNRKKIQSDDDICIPPSLIPLTPSFRMLSNIAQCDVMLYLMQTILDRCADLRARTFSDNIVRKLLFIIGFALWEEQHCISTSDPYVTFTTRAAAFKILEKMEALMSSLRINTHKNLLAWTIKKYIKVASLQNGTGDVDMSSSLSAQDQREARLKKKKAATAEQLRKKIMAQMSKAQVNFIKENSKYFDLNVPVASAEPSEVDIEMSEDRCESLAQRVALGPQQTSHMPEQLSFTCILCQEDQIISLDAPAMVLAAYVQNSTVLRQSMDKLQIPCSDLPHLLSANLDVGLHTSSCGHVMHAGCWQKYFDQIIARETSFRFHRQPLSFHVNKKEFLCPLCECLSNTVLPVMPLLWTGQPAPPSDHAPSLSLWLKFLLHFNYLFNMRGADLCDDTVLTQTSPRLRLFGTLDEVLATSDGLESVRQLLERSQPPATISSTLNDMIQYFAQCAYTVALDNLPDETDPRVIAIVWESIAYTLHATEWLLREQGKALMGDMPVRHRDTLQSMIRIGAALPAYSSIKHVIKCFLVKIIRKYFDKKSNSSILHVDAGSLLVNLSFASHGIVTESEAVKEYPSIPSGDSKDLLNTSTVFLLHIVQILLTGDFLEKSPSHADIELPENQSKEAAVLHEFLALAYNSCMECVPGISAHSLYSKVMEASIPWLRFAALLWHFVIGVVPPAELNEPGGDTYTALLGYLGLSDFFTKNFDADVKELALRWFVQGYSSPSKSSLTRYPLAHRKLVPLPDHYSELLNRTSSFVCPTKETEDSVTPTMCLICGDLVCSQNYCCQMEIEDGKLVGPCNYHAHTCGSGVGMFLRVRECRILLLVPGNRGCFQPAPYVDDYGEPDTNLKRGNPLHLCKDSYRSLYLRWLQHRIPEEVVRAMENTGLFSTLHQDFQYF